MPLVRVATNRDSHRPANYRGSPGDSQQDTTVGRSRRQETALTRVLSPGALPRTNRAADEVFAGPPTLTQRLIALRMLDFGSDPNGSKDVGPGID